ncbi:LGFP repeat-containing protein [Klenkia sp. PcliD-1-E]|uniref:LGFP repeat-containing protein n=1 Tax=Klenkia sp. PcliD-1-E TaxID=2954492 RepID=UPI002096DFA2|nr:hypothetical protein [Klenkia sp. PcliD-1-E]MCO7221583.1 hypothetical protein [Klenkia sp. PcliD-1-E]
MRTLARITTVLALVASALLLPTTGPEPTDAARAADLSYFDPGNIIADAVFFDSLAVDVPTVQAFLNAKGASCVAGEQPCLKDYRQTTATQAGDAYCSTYTGAADETAAAIIVKVGQACGINPRVLIVLLQKEQGLVTGTRPATIRYTKATGFACPDTAACNPEFSGFASQVYFAARQFQRYAANVAGSYRAGRNNTVLYNPNSACGSSQVYIQNKATAGLYSYTPYQPNAAALAAGYGTGDSCSSYGNRNFWNYFTDWFGSTQSAGGSAILDRYTAAGGPSGALGATTSAIGCGIRDGGCYQHYARGSIYWSPATGARALTGSVETRYGQLGWENGGLGFPTMDTWCGLTGGACFQEFQGGSLYAAGPAATAFLVRGGIRDKWGTTGWETGYLGLPTSDENCGLRNGGCFSAFQNGLVYYTPATGAVVVRSAVVAGWARLGFENGLLGYPTADTVCGLAAGGCSQEFQGGALFTSSSTAPQFVRGGIREAWQASGGVTGPLAYPTGDENCGLRSGGCFQTFTGGSVYWSPSTGAQVVRDPVYSRWAGLGWESGPLGYPTNSTFCGLRDGGCGQHFERGSLYWSTASGARLVRGAIRDAWAASGWETGPLGYPTSDENCGLAAGGCFETFTGGSVYWTPGTGARLVTGQLLTAWAAGGYETGRLGYPVENQRTASTGVVTQRFQGGTLTYDPQSGAVTGG